MNQATIFLPMLAQVLLTAVVFFYMYHTRIKEMRRKNIHPQQLATNQEGYKQLSDSYVIAEHFNNQFEMPVLFYILCLSLYVTQMVTPVFVAMVSAYVVIRIAHSVIHCTYKKGLHRFYVYMMSSLLLWIAWGMFVFKLIKQD